MNTERIKFYANQFALEYMYKGSVEKAIDPTTYSGYEYHMYEEEYYDANPRIVVPS